MLATSRSQIDVARALFQWLEQNNVAYAVVGDTRSYDSVISSDVDIIVSPKDLNRIPVTLRKFCDLQDGTLVQALQHEQTAWYFALHFTVESNGLFLHPDVCTDYYRQGRPLLLASELLTQAHRGPHGFFVPLPSKAFIYYLLKKIDKLRLDERQFDYLHSQWCEDREGAIQEVKRFWNSSNAALIAAAFDQQDFGQLCLALPQLQRALDKNLAVSWRDRWRELSRKVQRVLHPTGLFIAFLGPDGSGKSSVIERVEQDLAPAFRRAKRYHLRPNFGRSSGSGAPVTDPHGTPPRGMLPSLAKVGLWWLDYVWSYFSDILWRRVKSTLILFDRYFDDLAVDPRRYRYSGPQWLARLASRLVPRPDLVICLDAPPEVLQGRKQEVPPEETARQRQAYLDLARTLPNARVVDASRPLDEVVAEVEKIVLDHMAERTARRLGLEKA